ncbi:MAG: MBL fold metallo-hydrolase [Solirubrobacteraceae bacterium]
MIGDQDAGIAVVDPKLDIEEYLALAHYTGVRIEHVVETHNHADHVCGHGRLAAATGATIHIHRRTQRDYDHEPFGDGWELQLRSITVRAAHSGTSPQRCFSPQDDRVPPQRRVYRTLGISSRAGPQRPRRTHLTRPASGQQPHDLVAQNVPAAE